MSAVRNRIVIHIAGGALQGVYGDPALHVILVDEDDLEADGLHNNEPDDVLHNFVAGLPDVRILGPDDMGLQELADRGERRHRAVRVKADRRHL